MEYKKKFPLIHQIEKKRINARENSNWKPFVLVSQMRVLPFRIENNPLKESMNLIYFRKFFWLDIDLLRKLPVKLTLKYPNLITYKIGFILKASLRIMLINRVLCIRRRKYLQIMLSSLTRGINKNHLKSSLATPDLIRFEENNKWDYCELGGYFFTLR